VAVRLVIGTDQTTNLSRTFRTFMEATLA
jgi:hypothetical protein